MAGVNLNEENARILATGSELVGTQIRSCKDEAFLPASLLHKRLLETGTKYVPATVLSPTRGSLAVLLIRIVFFWQVHNNKEV